MMKWQNLKNFIKFHTDDDIHFKVHITSLPRQTENAANYNRKAGSKILPWEDGWQGAVAPRTISGRKTPASGKPAGGVQLAPGP